MAPTATTTTSSATPDGERGGGAVMLALPWPPGLGVAAVVVCAAVLGLARFVEMISEGGLPAYALFPLGLLAGGVAGVVAGLGLPRVLGVIFAALPWVAGALGSLYAAHRLDDAIVMVSPVDKPVLLAVGVAEVLADRYLGAVFTAGIALGLAVAQAVRVKRDGLAALAGAGAAFALFGLAVGSLLSASALREVLHAASSVSAADRATVFAWGVASLATVRWFGLVLGAVGVVFSLAALAAARRELAGALASLAVLAVGPLADKLVLVGPTAAAEALASAFAAPAAFPGLELLTLDGGAGDKAADLPAAALTASEIVVGDKHIAVPQDAADAAAVNRAVDEASAAIAAVARPPMGDVARRPLAVFVDARAGAVGLHVLVHAAFRADQDELDLVGRGPGLDDAKRAALGDVRSLSPFLGALLAVDPPQQAQVALGCGFATDIESRCRPLGDDETPAQLAAAAIAASKDGGGRLALDPHPKRDVLAGAGSLDGLFGEMGQQPGVAGSGAAPVVLGSLDKEVIRRVVKRNINQVRYCYEKELAQNPSLAGAVKLKWVINGTGAVANAQIVEDGLHAPAVSACLVARVRSWTFPAPRGGGIVIVNYPFTFSSQP